MNTAEKHFNTKDIQTILKHKLLESYLYNWANVLSNSTFGNNLRSFNFVDCFAGRGTFIDGNSGSPKIAMDSLFSIQKYFKMNYGTPIQFNIYTIETINEYHNKLTELKELSPYPNQINNYHGEFEAIIDNITERTNGVPSFYFIDPFGFKGIPMEKIKNILELQSHEVLINVMSYSLVRNIKNEKTAKSLSTFFGIDSLTNDLYSFIQKTKIVDHFYMDAEIMKLEEKIVNFYIKQLKNKLNNKIYVLKKRISSQLNPNVYFHLLFATSKVHGLSEMKYVLNDFDANKSEIEKEYSKKFGLKISSKNYSIFDDEFIEKTYDYNDFLRDLMLNFNNTSTSFEDIVIFFLENTPLRFKSNDENSIYGFIKKLEKEKNYFSRSKGALSSLGKAKDITINVKLTDKVIERLVYYNNIQQLSLF